VILTLLVILTALVVLTALVTTRVLTPSLLLPLDDDSLVDRLRDTPCFR